MRRASALSLRRFGVQRKRMAYQRGLVTEGVETGVHCRTDKSEGSQAVGDTWGSIIFLSSHVCTFVDERGIVAATQSDGRGCKTLIHCPWVIRVPLFDPVREAAAQGPTVRYP